MSPRDVSSRIRQAAGGRSMASIARASGVPMRTIQRLAAAEDKCGPRVDTLAQIARALGVTPGWLAYGEGPEPPG